MNFIELTKEQISDFIINDPQLVYMGFSDKELIYMHEKGKYSLVPGSYYIGLENDDGLVCILKYEYFTDICVCIHPYVSSKYHGKGVLSEIYTFLYEHFIKQTEIRKVIAFVSDSCIHAIKACEKHGFKKEGHITNCQVWRKELIGIYIYGLDLKSEKKNVRV
jgi:RimJ/RimL family protein N-acetyltransferase